MTHPATWPVEKLLGECRETRTRRSGPGGQHRNKTETAVVLEHVPSGLVAEANERRSQAENRQVAIFRLRLQLAVKWRVSIAPDAVPSELWRSRCHRERLAISTEHSDFPALLAEALDLMAVVEFDVKRAASNLGVTPSQLVKLLKQEPPALSLVNAAREANGQHRLL